MAITKIHGIKATVSGAVKYICNPDKTDSSILISSYGTSPETAANDFKFILSHTDQSDPNKAFHLIQSFAPGEVSPEEAHKIGQELADRLLQGKHSYIVATHTDHGHIHNHIIFCAADNIDYQKYHDCKRTYWNIRRINDELCEEHNLSVIRENQYKSKSYKEWQSDKNSTSWKTRLKSDINECVKQAHTYNEFLSLMIAKGYEIKDAEISENAHKYIGFRAPGQQRWIRGRAKSLGPEYTKERIKERIEERARIRAERMEKLTVSPARMIDTTEERFANSPGLKKWADRQNLKAAAKIQSELAGMGFKSLADVDEKIDTLHRQAKSGKKAVVLLDRDIKTFSEILTFGRQYAENKKYDINYKKSKDQERYYRQHHDQLILAWGAADRLKSCGVDPSTMDLQEIEEHYRQLCTDRSKIYSSYKSIENEMERLNTMRHSLTAYIEGDDYDHITRDRKPSRE